MKNFYKTTFKTFVLAAASFIAVPAQAQLGDVGEILRAGAADANILAREYLKPFGQGFGAGLNSGWYMRANSHSFLGFSVALRVGLAQVPTVDQSFISDHTTLGLQKLTLVNGSPSTTPTLSGSDTDATAVYEIREQGQSLGTLEMPKGTGLPYVPTVMIQGAVGLFFDTDVTVRYMPETEIPDFGNIGLMGASVKHGLNQWLPIYLPVDVAIQAGFTNLNVNSALDVRPSSGSDIRDDNPASTWENQKIEFKSSGYTYNLLVGKELDLFILGISLYGGIGMESATTTVATPGSYPVLTVNDNVAEYVSGVTKKVIAIDQPLDLEFAGANSFRATVGAKVRLFLVNVVAEYTHATYPMASVGVAISIR